MTFRLQLTPNLKTLVLNKCHDLIELHRPVAYTELASLNRKHSKSNTLDLELAPNLVRLTLTECPDLVELHRPINGCLNLKDLKLSRSNLETLDLGLTPNLERLDLEECHNLVKLHMPINGCPKLRSLNLTHAKLETLDLGLTPNLEWLVLQDCYHLVELNTPIGYLERLYFLNLNGCLGFKYFVLKRPWGSYEFHVYAESLFDGNHQLPKFKFSCVYAEPYLYEKFISLGITRCKNLKSFLESISGLRHLNLLQLDGSILEVPMDLDQLQFLEKLEQWSTVISHLPDRICMLKHLESLILESRFHLENLPEYIGQLECLEELYLSSTRIKHLPDSI